VGFCYQGNLDAEVKLPPAFKAKPLADTLSALTGSGKLVKVSSQHKRQVCVP
jgi:hypothetical protein